MGQSTDGIICYGVYTGEDHPIPGAEKFDDDVEDWWKDRLGYKPPFEMFDEDGMWIGGKKWPDEKCREYYDHKYAWEKAHPMPFEMVNVCSYDCPMWIICVPGTKTVANRGYPVEINQSILSLMDHLVALEQFNDFLKEVGINEEPRWYLGSFWG